MMTEAEWLSCTDPVPMLDYLQVTGRASERKLRLFLVACSRLVWTRLPSGVMRDAVEVSEQYADGLVSDEERQQLSDRMWAIPVEHRAATQCNWFTERSSEDVSAYMCAMLSVGRLTGSRITSRPTWQAGRRTTGADQPGLLREIFGNFFRPVAFDSSWRAEPVERLARQMYESRNLDALPEFANALETAGCDNDDILNHCRGPGPHVRGCHVVDWVLGRE